MSEDQVGEGARRKQQTKGDWKVFLIEAMVEGMRDGGYSTKEVMVLGSI